MSYYYATEKEYNALLDWLISDDNHFIRCLWKKVFLKKKEKRKGNGSFKNPQKPHREFSKEDHNVQYSVLPVIKLAC